MSSQRSPVRRLDQGAEPGTDLESPMTRHQPWKTQLWNVSLFPVPASPQDSGPTEPSPSGSSAMTRPALLSITEPHPSPGLARAA